jgi:hypothetical protein
MDDRPKRQTSTATPAEPGDLPWEVSERGSSFATAGFARAVERPPLSSRFPMKLRRAKP